MPFISLQSISSDNIIIDRCVCVCVQRHLSCAWFGFK